MNLSKRDNVTITIDYSTEQRLYVYKNIQDYIKMNEYNISSCM